jgi:hypothetical protein
MTDSDSDFEGIDVVIELEGADEALADSLRQAFSGPDEDVIFSHAFGGKDTVAILFKLGKATVSKLLDVAAKLKSSTPNTMLKIEDKSISASGFTPEAIQQILGSPGFKDAVQAVQRK